MQKQSLHNIINKLIKNIGLVFLPITIIFSGCILRTLKNSEDLVKDELIDGTEQVEFTIATDSRTGTPSDIKNLTLYICKNEEGLNLIKVLTFTDFNNESISYDSFLNRFRINTKLDPGQYIVYITANYTIANNSLGTNKYVTYKELEIAHQVSANSEINSLTGDIPMTAVAKIDVSGNKNTVVPIELVRLWARVKVNWDASLITNLKKVLGSQTVPVITYQLHNIPTKSFLFNTYMEFVDNKAVLISNAPLSRNVSYAKNLIHKSTSLSETGAVDYEYIPENIVDGSAGVPTKNSVTYISLRIQFLPAQLRNSVRYFDLEESNKACYPKIFLAMKDGKIYKENGSVVWFIDEVSAENICPGCVTKAFKLDEIYLRIDLVDKTVNTANPYATENYYVLRNSQYNVKILSIDINDQFPVARKLDLDGYTDYDLVNAKSYNVTASFDIARPIRNSYDTLLGE